MRRKKRERNLLIRIDGRDALLDEQGGCLIYMRAAFRLSSFCIVAVNSGVSVMGSE
jgi:hypothetical protein